MLRNGVAGADHDAVAVLNEVLSLNAQELMAVCSSRPIIAFLNEVLSLNAQEFEPVPAARAGLARRSSMKS